MSEQSKLALKDARKILADEDEWSHYKRIARTLMTGIELAQAVANTTLYDEETGFDEDAWRAIQEFAQELLP